MSSGLHSTFQRGAFPTPTHRIWAASEYSFSREIRTAPAQVAYVPAKLSAWYNDRYGVCVTSEECFAKACFQPEIFIPDDIMLSWAIRHGVRDGASLDEVLDFMVDDGFLVGAQRYNDGRKMYVDYGNQDLLQSAIAQGPVKIAIAADALPSGAGGQNGWYTLGSRTYRNTDHCVSIAGYGPADWLYAQLGVPLPRELAANPTQWGYLIFTWGTIGFVTFPWLLGTCAEAWLRDPTTVGIPPLTPTPTPPPLPPPSPTPNPTPTPPPPVPTPVITATGEVRFPFVGGSSGSIVVACGATSAEIKFRNISGRRFVPVVKPKT